MAHAAPVPVHWPRAAVPSAHVSGYGRDGSEPCCSSVIIYNFYLMGIAVFEAKANPPRPVDRDRPLASSVALEWMQPDALERADVIQSFGRVQDCQQLQRRVETAKS